MATVFISYKGEDQNIVNSLAPLLEGKGHKIRFDQELFIGRAKGSPKPWEWTQVHEIGCCSPVGEHLRVQVLPD